MNLANTMKSWLEARDAVTAMQPKPGFDAPQPGGMI
jgi:hypothetical protein